VKKGNAVTTHKHTGKSTLRHELGVDNLAGGEHVVDPGSLPSWCINNIFIFNKVLCHYYLELGEQVEADNGYVGHPDKIKCPNNCCNPAENKEMQGKVKVSSPDNQRVAQKLWDSLPGLATTFCATVRFSECARSSHSS
jgi:hypothetical protein